MEERHFTRIREAVEILEKVANELPEGSPEWEKVIGPLCELEEIINPLTN